MAVHDRFLLTAHYTDGTVTTHRLDADAAPTSSASGARPRHCAVDPTGFWLYAANQHAGSVTWLPRDPGSGALGAPAGSVTVRGAAMVAFT
ncbi:beta-propeller fold lactonase family protein [Actinokineospora sp.]|uniref:beta-propeller fold lactonase family protein n=1 Tax=Actinokineospora sp. TaxID=1872133 RepID=UPI004037D33F